MFGAVHVPVLPLDEPPELLPPLDDPPLDDPPELLQPLDDPPLLEDVVSPSSGSVGPGCVVGSGILVVVESIVHATREERDTTAVAAASAAREKLMRMEVTPKRKGEGGEAASDVAQPAPIQ